MGFTRCSRDASIPYQIIKEIQHPPRSRHITRITYTHQFSLSNNQGLTHSTRLPCRHTSTLINRENFHERFPCIRVKTPTSFSMVSPDTMLNFVGSLDPWNIEGTMRFALERPSREMRELVLGRGGRSASRENADADPSLNDILRIMIF